MESISERVSDAMGLASRTGGNLNKGEVQNAVNSYEKYHTQYGGKDASRALNYSDMVNKYYDLATSFYEYGWGESFHFAHRVNNETLRESIKRHEHFLALRLGLSSGMKVLDVGCGVGGPLREIALFSGASVTGLNNNAYQVSRGEELNRRTGLHKSCDYLKADFMKIPAASGTFDAVYAIEATCHAPDAVACYKEILRVLKPGGLFAAYEWCVTDAFDASKAEHQRCKAQIELGNGLPDIRTTEAVVRALREAGFEVLEAADLAKTAQVPWYQPLDPDHFSLSQFRLTIVGRAITRMFVWTLETLRIAPRGTYQVAQFLEEGADGLVLGGKKEIFSPLFFLLAKKPASA